MCECDPSWSGQKNLPVIRFRFLLGILQFNHVFLFPVGLSPFFFNRSLLGDVNMIISAAAIASKMEFGNCRKVIDPKLAVSFGCSAIVVCFAQDQ